MSEFITSIPAQAAGRCIIETARSQGFLDEPVMVSPRLADAEKVLIIKMFPAMEEHCKTCGESLHPDEVSSLFTFVFAKAAECVTNFCNGKEDNFELTGMFDGRVPIYADDNITTAFKSSQFPFLCAANYLEWTEADAENLRDCDPLLLLFEALKWCFRLSCHYAMQIVEKTHQ